MSEATEKKLKTYTKYRNLSLITRILEKERTKQAIEFIEKGTVQNSALGICVEDITSEFNKHVDPTFSQPESSAVLGNLKECGFCSTIRDGKYIYYKMSSRYYEFCKTVEPFL